MLGVNYFMAFCKTPIIKGIIKEINKPISFKYIIRKYITIWRFVKAG